MNHNKVVVGILAHVDAGKTTLSESMLYLSKSIRKLGRVDHKDAFLDTHELEKARGITIFSKQAVFTLGSMDITLMDTPGHVDFSGEMERTLFVLDYAILIVNGADGIQGHTLTLWKLLKHYKLPVFIFINKMDQSYFDKKTLQKELTTRLNENCIDFTNEGCEEFYESIAMCDDAVLERYLEEGSLSLDEIKALIAKRKIFPCYFGSALKLDGIWEFMSMMNQYIMIPEYSEKFGARIYKITRDKQGNRLTHMKITGGSLKVKDYLTNKGDANDTGDSSDHWEEKVDQIRIYSGEKHTVHDEVFPGMICCVTGPAKTYAGEGLGIETSLTKTILEPILTYQLLFRDGRDAYSMLPKLRQLEEENPLLHILWNEQLGEMYVQVMGEVEIEILKSIIKDRFDAEVDFLFGGLIYKETILKPSIGLGHFEPLRHYAEVHLLLEPGELGSGLRFDSDLSTDVLSRSWQRLILTHLKEIKHKGILTGSEITDMKITLIGGKAHIKHTEGGDFRQAVLRAVRQGLKRADNILLEPVYEFQVIVPIEMTGRVMSDIQKMNGRYKGQEIAGDQVIINGYAPVYTMRGYQMELVQFSKGYGRLFCTLKGYEPCHNSSEIISSKGYEPENDIENPISSIFISHGTGFMVGWEDVEKYVHLEVIRNSRLSKEQNDTITVPNADYHTKTSYTMEEEKELEKIFIKTYGESKRDKNLFKRKSENNEIKNNEIKINPDDTTKDSGEGRHNNDIKEKYLLVDGYNIIFAWEELRKLADDNLDSARYKLMDTLCSYQGFTGITLIAVFDAYRVKGGQGNIDRYHNIHVVYTKEAETADQYIEKTVHKIGKKHDVTVATSDALEQMIIWGGGARRLSASGLKELIKTTEKEIKESMNPMQKDTKNYPFGKLNS